MKRMFLVVLAYVVVLLSSLGVVWLAVASALKGIHFYTFMYRGGPGFFGAIALGISVVFAAMILVIGREDRK